MKKLSVNLQYVAFECRMDNDIHKEGFLGNIFHTFMSVILLMFDRKVNPCSITKQCLYGFVMRYRYFIVGLCIHGGNTRNCYAMS